MLEFIVAACITVGCYVSPDYSVVQLPIAPYETHPDDTDRYTEGGITIIAVPAALRI